MRIALADDHRIVRSGLRWALESEPGIEVVGEAADGGELLTLLDGTEVDIVLLDIRMPGMGGLEALPQIRRDYMQTRVVILSMHDDPAFIRAAIEKGASGYLLKSAGMEELLAALRAVDAGKSYVQSTLTKHVLRTLTAATSQLSVRARDALQMVADGLGTAEMAQRLSVSESTVKAILQQAFEDLGVSSRAQAVATALRRGLIE